MLKNTSAQHVKLSTPHCTLPLKAFEEVGKFFFLGTEMRSAAEQTVVCLDVNKLWKPGQSFYFTWIYTFSVMLTLRHWETTKDTGCDSALLRNCVDHPANRNLFQKRNPIPNNSVINSLTMI